MSNKKIVPIKNKNNKTTKTLKISWKRLLAVTILIVIVFVILTSRVGYLQFIKGSELKEQAYSQSTSSTIISAKRGTIYDSNGKALALSADVDTISVNPSYIVVKKGNKTDDDATKTLKENMAKAFQEIFDLDYNTVYAKLTSNNSVETIVSKVETEKVEKFKTWLSNNNVATGVNIDADTKRYYPYDNLASNLIGFCGTNNQGLEGVELSYDDLLKGTSGRLTTAVSVSKDIIPDEDEEYIAPENGSNIYLTIDSNIQTIAEKYLKQAVEENNCKRGGSVVIMNPSNGEILAMATYPDYNLNTPYTPNASIATDWNSLSTQEQSNKLYTMWRNKSVVDTYEPGSTFKVITASIALEENLVKTDTPGDFYCNGSQVVADKTIKCTATSGHGSESLRLALENSCNPALIQLGQRIGASTFYKYLKAFGLFGKTGVDLPSEGTSSFWSEENVGAVELATMSFGQRFTITPLQLLRSASAIANNGVLVTPHVVKEIENSDTGTITTVNTETGTQVISEETADKMKDMMHSVVSEGGGKYAQVKGYEIGGKTGTSEPDPNHLENGYVSSFLAIAPVENTKVTVLLTLYAPQSSNYYGGHIAAPAVSQILSEVLPYLDIPSNDVTTADTSEKVSVPNLKNKTISEAEKQLESLGLKYSTNATSDDIITEQMPISGTQLVSGGIVKLYTSGNDERISQQVPDLKGVSFAQAKIMLAAKNLNITSTGSGIVIAQDPKSGTSVDEGTVVNVTLQEATGTSQH